MKLKIKEINKIAMGLHELGEVKMVGPLKFKIIRNIKIVDDILEDVIAANNNSIDVPVELLENEVDVILHTFTQEELNDLEISSNTLYQLYDIIEGVEDEIKSN